MPIADPEQSRTYQREYKRLVRAGSCQTPGQTQVPVEFRLQTASDVLELFGGQAEAVLAPASRKNDGNGGRMPGLDRPNRKGCVTSPRHW